MANVSCLSGLVAIASSHNSMTTKYLSVILRLFCPSVAPIRCLSQCLLSPYSLSHVVSCRDMSRPWSDVTCLPEARRGFSCWRVGCAPIHLGGGAGDRRMARLRIIIMRSWRERRPCPLVRRQSGAPVPSALGPPDGRIGAGQIGAGQIGAVPSRPRSARPPQLLCPRIYLPITTWYLHINK